MKQKYQISIVVFLIFITIMISHAQEQNVGIGTQLPDKSAVLDIQAIDKGLLIPRLSKNQILSIKEPATGLLVYQTSNNGGFYYFNGKEWKPISDKEANAIATVDANGWALDGNAISNSNKAAATAASFIGTPAGVPINFKIGGVNSGIVGASSILLSLGFEAGLSTTGASNTAIGYRALKQNTTGTNNVAVGTNALTSSTGASNVGVGSAALLSNTTGQSNTAVGTTSLRNNNTGRYNVAVGDGSMFFNTSGEYNMAVGFAALRENTVGRENMAIGVDALRNYTGNSNVAIGTGAGRGVLGSSTGSGNVFIGSNAGASEVASNKLYLSNSNTTTPLVYGDFSARFVSIGNVPVDKRETVASSGNYSLIVEKGILSEKLKVALKSTGDWADYVFEPEYKANMLTLEEVEAFTIKNKHLPNVPSAGELVEKGLDFNETSRMFMEKIEELTLYMIEINKEMKALKAENASLKLKLNK